MALKEKNIDIRDKRLFLFRGRDVLVSKDGALPEAEAVEESLSCRPMIEDTLSAAVATMVTDDDAAPGGFQYIPIREYFFGHAEEEAAALSRMRSYLMWRMEMKYCPACGSPLSLAKTENAIECAKCGKIYFPRIEPCVIVLISSGDEILLLRHRNRNQNTFACLAGFIEVGETAEQAVRREIREEVGLEVKNLRYVGSQGWPFPDQLMLAFTAEYESGEIKLQADEISEAKWFKRDELPDIPARGSIAWRLINGKF